VTRLYVPATVRTLGELDRDGFLVAGEDDVVVAPDDSEDTEYDALMTAAETSAGWAAELGPGERRRVVVVAEVGAMPTGPAARVELTEVVAVHADASDPGDLADPDLLGDLCWFATQEISDLLAH
jgi:Family of unknown function (DUF6912)